MALSSTHSRRHANNPLSSAVNWLFEDRKTGRLVLWQMPNVPLWVWIASMIVRLPLHDAPRTVVSVVGSLALATWAVMEVGWGVNPFRRMLGAAVLLAGIAGLLLR